MAHIIQADTPSHYAAAKRLFQAYADSLDFDLDFQDFEAEMTSLPGSYAPPDGCILLAENDARFIGCVALRKIDNATCEMKRLYVDPAFRGKHIGRALAERLIDAARAKKYQRMRLDTVLSMTAANQLYVALGFSSIRPYCYNPLDQARYYELALG